MSFAGSARVGTQDQRSLRLRSTGSEARWTCHLCSQTRNTEENETCITCGRARGHDPEKYRKRLQEIRKWNGHGDSEYDDEFRWSDSWGLILGLLLLAVIIGLLVWAYYEDQKEALGDQDNNEL
mmetsp:Transcript_83736/g.217999  ORF Transcript_83736/g.217999 Transcript_83736/m.217999 type:complete len:124 (+) Transcript_83736:60-431(+)